MALNPPLSSDGTPFRLEHEVILCDRKGMEAEVKVKGMSKLGGKGKVYLTSARLIFVNKSFKNSKFKAIDMPVAMMRDFKFKQPVFGSNYLQFEVKPLFQLLPDVAKIKLWFTHGGCDKFLRIFETVSKDVHRQRKEGRLSKNMQKNWENGMFNKNKGFQDPSDPTTIFTTQPPVFNKNLDYIGNNVYMDRDINYPIFQEDAPKNPNQNQYNPNNPNPNQNNPNNPNQYNPNNPNPNQYNPNNPNQYIPNPNQYNPNPNQYKPNQNQYNPNNHNPNNHNPNQYNPNQNQYNPNNMNQNNPNNQNPNQYNPNPNYPNMNNNMNQNYPNLNNNPNPNYPNMNNNMNQNYPNMNNNINNPNPNNNMNPNNQYNQQMNQMPQLQNPYPVMNQNNQPKDKYFGFFGPTLEKNDNR